MEEKYADKRGEVRHRGPNLGVVAVVFTLLFVGSLVSAGVMTKGGHFPSPFGPEDLSRKFFSEHADAVLVSSFLQFGAAIPLGIYTATVVSRLQFLGMNVAGVFISLFGGFAASLFGAMSAAFQWALAQPGIAIDAGATRVLHLLAFASGGPGFVSCFGLLMAGVCVISWFARLLPRWLVWLGLVLAVVAEFSTLSLVLIPVGFLLPIARFLGFVWLIATGFLLPKGRSGVQPRAGEVAA